MINNPSRIGIAPQDLRDPDVVWLSARAAALLVVLRAAPLNIWHIAHALGEHEPTPEPRATREVVDWCTDLGLVFTRSDPGLSYPRVWLTEAGIAWLQRQGLDARYRPSPDAMEPPYMRNTCPLPSALKLPLLSAGESPCARCYQSRAKCGGDPRFDGEACP